MFKALTLCSVVLVTTVPAALAQTAAHRAVGNLLSNQQTAPTAGNLAAGQFPTEQAAKAHCPGDAIVWANTGGSRAYHTSGDRYFGKTKHGAYMCQKEADQTGYHAAGSRGKKAVAKTTSTKATAK